MAEHPRMIIYQNLIEICSLHLNKTSPSCMNKQKFYNKPFLNAIFPQAYPSAPRRPGWSSTLRSRGSCSRCRASSPTKRKSSRRTTSWSDTRERERSVFRPCSAVVLLSVDPENDRNIAGIWKRYKIRSISHQPTKRTGSEGEQIFRKRILSRVEGLKVETGKMCDASYLRF